MYRLYAPFRAIVNSSDCRQLCQHHAPTTAAPQAMARIVIRAGPRLGRSRVAIAASGPNATSGSNVARVNAEVPHKTPAAVTERVTRYGFVNRRATRST